MLQLHSTLFFALFVLMAIVPTKACPYLQAQNEEGPTRQLRKASAVTEGQLDRGAFHNPFSRMLRHVNSSFRGLISGVGGNNGGNPPNGGGGGLPINGGGNINNNGFAASINPPPKGSGQPNNNNPPPPLIPATPLTGLTRDQALAGAKADIASILDGNLAAAVVRLAFHDCVGGCDGCVDTNSSQNFGLDMPIQALSNIVSRYSRTALTRADVWVLAALTAAEVTQRPGGGPNNGGGVGSPNNGGNNTNTVPFPMKFVGRPVCAGNKPTGGPRRKLPSAHFYTQQVLDYFSSNFGFSTKDTVAILGAHTLYVQK